MNSQLLGYSPLTDTDLPLGEPTTDLDALLELGDSVATIAPNLIVHIKGPALQQWKDA